eukprot:9056450-Heterocapsa_arctica.AAC.1
MGQFSSANVATALDSDRGSNDRQRRNKRTIKSPQKRHTICKRPLQRVAGHRVADLFQDEGPDE